MKFIPESDNLNDYLADSEIIDYKNKEIVELAKSLAEGKKSDVEIARAAYHFVRDSIAHSLDINGKHVTYKASGVLRYREGVCYAKSHLLAAILRYLGIPTGLCYQHLILDDTIKPWLVLHGLNAIFLKSIGKWIRVDARGNKEGVQAEFSIDKEILAFPVREELGEVDFPIIYANPNDKVISALISNKSVPELDKNLPQAL